MKKNIIRSIGKYSRIILEPLILCMFLQLKKGHMETPQWRLLGGQPMGVGFTVLVWVGVRYVGMHSDLMRLVVWRRSWGGSGVRIRE
jgi:hypothetical protein